MILDNQVIIIEVHFYYWFRLYWLWRKSPWILLWVEQRTWHMCLCGFWNHLLWTVELYCIFAHIHFPVLFLFITNC